MIRFNNETYHSNKWERLYSTLSYVWNCVGIRILFALCIQEATLLSPVPNPNNNDQPLHPRGYNICHRVDANRCKLRSHLVYAQEYITV